MTLWEFDLFDGFLFVYQTSHDLYCALRDHNSHRSNILFV